MTTAKPTLTSRLPLACAALIAWAAPGALAQGGGGPGGPGGPPVFAGLPPVQAPGNNAITLAKTRLGMAIFWDEQLSAAGTMACGTCHIPSAGGSDPRSADPLSGALHPGADGIFGTSDDVIGSLGTPRRLASGAYEESASFGLGPQVTDRKAPTMINATFFRELFWDGRAEESFVDPLTGAQVSGTFAALESQAVDPPLSEIEMGHVGSDWATLSTRFAAARPLRLATQVPASLSTWINDRSYPELFADAFGTPDVTPVRMAQALATYQRTLISDEAPVDFGPNALTPQQNMGLQVFNGPARCVMCHGGPRLTDDEFHNTGVSNINSDLGRFLVTGNNPDRGRFKTPDLRNISLRGPFFHDGSAQTLGDVVDFYARGGDFHVNQAPQLQPFNINPGQRAALIAFLEVALLDPRVAAESGPFERPTLWSESNLAPEIIGQPTPGSGGLAPQIIAIEPPYRGNPDFAIALQQARANRFAVLGLDRLGTSVGLPFAGTTSYLSMGSSVIITGLQATTPTLDGNGTATTVLEVPDLPQLGGITFHAQWFVIDSGGPSGLSASEAARFTIL